MKLDLRLDLKVSRPRYLGLDLRFNFSLKFGVGQSFVAAHNAYLNYALVNFFCCWDARVRKGICIYNSAIRSDL